jgi:cysteine desulfurase/selenocysteine lyase
MEHHSNLIPWQQVCAATGAKLVYLRPNEDFVITPEEVADKVGPRTKLVSVAHVSNVLGVENPVRAIADAAHAVGALVVVDAAQSVPHVRVDVSELGCDLMAFSAHKLMGPMGVGVLWGRRDVLESMPPFLTGGEMIDSVTETGAVWAPIPQKFEAGTQDAAGIYAFDAGLSYIEGKGRDVLEERERALASYLCARLVDVPHVDVVGPTDPAAHVGAVSFNLGDIHPHDVASLLDMDDVAIRAGHHCAQPLLAWMGIESCCRASVAFYNDAADVDRLADGLGRVWEVFHGNE